MLRRGSGDSMYTRKAHETREAPRRGQRGPTGSPRGTGWAPWGGGEFVVPRKPGNAGGGKGPPLKTDAIRGEGPRRLGNLSTPITPHRAGGRTCSQRVHVEETGTKKGDFVRDS